jgi:glycosyltransferase involved in cell wall biosynthesis
MIREILGFIILGIIGLLFLGGCFRLMEKVSTDQMQEELESWDAGDHEWMKQLFEERRREARETLTWGLA